MHAEFARELVRIARPPHADDDLGLELDNAVFALDASTMDLCLSVFPWAFFRSTKPGSSCMRCSTCGEASPRSSMFRAPSPARRSG